ncbi:MAG: peptidoglycan DD-metalloendopeptidase family protein [Candidatus Pacebacteria bacterium]|nr:peptidoglycan DD-metalloendopeptidase family protein [Candidatus Paceibacterota bacterium]
MKFKSLTLIFLFLMSFAIGGRVLAVETPEELRKAIEEKNKSLEEINKKILETQKVLDETGEKSKDLQQEIKKINSNISSLNLGIRSSEINISKLKLEIEEVQYEINDTEKEIGLKRDAVARLLQELQKKDGETTLTIFLKNQSLADGLAEVNEIIDINSGLSGEVNKLQSLNDQLNQKLGKSASKKKNLEVENINLKNKKVITESAKSEKQTVLVQTKNQEKTYQEMLKDLEAEQDNIASEITIIEDKLRASFDPTLLPGKRTGVFAWPVTLIKDGGMGRISSNYGQVRPKLDKGRPHRGVDIAAPSGTPVFAAEDGKVVAVDNNDASSWKKYQYGKYVFIEHQNNLATIYAHLSAQVVHKGDIVKRGDLIGYVGNTGYSTGPHLHFGAYWAPSMVFKSIPPAKGLVPIGVYVNPQDYL